jgi:hypothetical protein
MNNHSYNTNGTAVVEVEGSVEYAMEEQLTANLEIVAPAPARVTFMEEGPDGEEQPRVAEIRTYVPVFVFNEMLRDRQRILKDIRRKKLAILRSEENDGTDEVKEMLEVEAKELEQSVMGEWVQEQVFKVWKRTEKDMSLKRFQCGLDFEQIQGLFTRFFGGLMRSKQAKDKLRQRD